MIPEWRLQMMANYIFRKYLSGKDKVLMLANSMLEAHIADTEDTADYSTLLEEKTNELSRLNKKLDNFIEMRSEREISKEVFKLKATELEPKIIKLQSEIAELEAKQNEVPEIVDYQEKLTVLQYALEQYTNADEKDVPESVIEAFVEKIVAAKDGFDWYLRFDGDPTNPLNCTTKGKRKSNTSITVAGEPSPAIHNSDTGCYT